MEIISAPRRRSPLARHLNGRDEIVIFSVGRRKRKADKDSFSPSTLLYSALLQIATYGTIAIGSLRRPGGGEQCASGACGQRRQKGDQILFFPARPSVPRSPREKVPFVLLPSKEIPIIDRVGRSFVLLLSPLISISHDASSHSGSGGTCAGITVQITQHAVSVVAAGVAVRARVGLCSSLALLTI